MRVRAMAVVFSSWVVAGACATGGGGGGAESIDPSAPRACINIDNRQGAGSMERIYLVEAASRQDGSVQSGFGTARQRGEGTRIGDAPVGRVTRWCTQGIQLPERYFIRVERPSNDNRDPAKGQAGDVNGWQYTPTELIKETQDIVIEPGDLWTWEVRRDRFTCLPGGAAAGGDC